MRLVEARGTVEHVAQELCSPNAPRSESLVEHVARGTVEHVAQGIGTSYIPRRDILAEVRSGRRGRPWSSPPTLPTA